MAVIAAAIPGAQNSRPLQTSSARAYHFFLPVNASTALRPGSACFGSSILSSQSDMGTNTVVPSAARPKWVPPWLPPRPTWFFQISLPVSGSMP